jgi:hypothetical protein
VKWVRIDSWHILDHEDAAYTLCGLGRPPGEVVDRLPGGSATSCENCLIVMAGRDEGGNVDELMSDVLPSEEGIPPVALEPDDGPPPESDDDAGIDDDDKQWTEV